MGRKQKTITIGPWTLVMPGRQKSTDAPGSPFSYYTFGGAAWDGDKGQTWILASDVEEQQEAYCQKDGSNRFSPVYPSHFSNFENVNLSEDKWKSRRGLVHAPVVPGQHVNDKHPRAGLVRTMFYACRPRDFRVIFHDPKKPLHKGSKYRPFVEATRHGSNAGKM